MRKFSVLFILFGGTGLVSSIQAQSNQSIQPPNQQQTSIGAPSDAPHGYTYDFYKVQEVLINCQLQPDEDNGIAKPLTKEASFPKLKGKSNVTEAYLDDLKTWMEKHSDLIINTLKSRSDIVQTY